MVNILIGLVIAMKVLEAIVYQ